MTFQYTTTKRPKSALRADYKLTASGSVRQRTVEFSGTETTTSARNSGGEVNLLATFNDGRYRGFYSKYDNGHEWNLERFRYYKPSMPYVTLQGNAAGVYYRGSLCPDVDSIPDWGSISTVSQGNLAGYGPTAVSRTAPTNPNINLAVSLAELVREGLPRVLRLSEKVNPANFTGGNYLGYQFGLAPILSELKSLIRILQTSNALIAQYNRDSGRHVRRRAVLLNTVTSTSANYNVGLLGGDSIALKFAKTPSSDPYGFGGIRPPATLTTTLSERVWFSGAYQYAAPRISETGLTDFARRADKLLGLRLDLETLWNLAPWSWLIDWFATIGDAINVADALSADGLFMHYGYLMRHVERRKTLTIPLWHTLDGHVFTDLTITGVRERKQRIRANPYGFGLKMSDLTTSQGFILGAYGLTRIA